MSEALEQDLFIIAEAGVCHNGNLDTALELIEGAARAGADAVKFQLFKAAKLSTKHVSTAGYQKLQGQSEKQLDMLARLELPDCWIPELLKACEYQRVEFMATAFDSYSLDLLRELPIRRFKISSGDLTNVKFLFEHGAAQKPILVSTGMATLDEIEIAIKFLFAGYHQLDPKSVHELPLNDPSIVSFANKYLTVLQCTSCYPTPLDKSNLGVIQTYLKKLPGKVGFSDHTMEVCTGAIAVGLGATVLEKHFTLDKHAQGPDHFFSLAVPELTQYVGLARASHKSSLITDKRPEPDEFEAMQLARKRLFASCSIKHGDSLGALNMVPLRGSHGICASEYFNVTEKHASKDLKTGDPIEAT